MKAVKGKLPAERVEAFEKGAAAFTKKIAANFEGYTFVRPCVTSLAVAYLIVFLVHWCVGECRRHGCAVELSCKSTLLQLAHPLIVPSQEDGVTRTNYHLYL